MISETGLAASLGLRRRANALVKHLSALAASSSALVLIQVLSAGPAAAACVTDTLSVPGTTIVTCSGPLATAAPGTPGVNANVAGANGINVLVGGDGGNAGNAPHLVVQSTSDVVTAGDFSHAIFAASSGGNGGVLSVAGNGGNGGNAGMVDVQSTGDLTTKGDGAHGIFAISQGGLGGVLSVSGNGGNAGHSDDVSVDASGIISTSGDGAHGIAAQSLGGAGQSLSVAGSGGDGGGAGTVSVDSNADITTTGAASHGIFVTSTGGHGAVLSVSGNGGNGGGASTASVDSKADITTTGAASHGIFVTSTGGHGGNLSVSGSGGNGGNGGDVSITSSGAIKASGAGSHGIFASSTGGAGGFLAVSGVGGAAGVGGAVDITIAGGSVTGGSGTGTGVQVDAGTIVTLDNAGMIAALSGNALNLTGQSVTVENQGTIEGNVALNGIGGGTFNNNAGGILNSGDTIALGSGMLTNAGTLSPGGKGTVKTTALTGGLTQTRGGTFEADVDLNAGTADLLTVTGAAALSGQVAGNIVSFDSAALNTPITILTAAGGVTDNGLTVSDTLLVDYELLYPDANTVALTLSVDFLGAAAGLTPNQTAVASNLNSILGAGGSLPVMAAMLNITSVDELTRVLDQLAPAGDGATFASAMATGNTFGSQLLSCRTLGDGGGNSFIREGQCLWVRASASHLDNDGGRNRTSFEETATFYSAGGQFDLGGAWRLGGGIGFEQGDLRTDADATSETERLHLGAVLKYNPGPWLFAASLTGGHGWADNTRDVTFDGFDGRATSNTDVSFIAGRLTGAYLMSFGHWYAKPQVDLSITRLERDGYRERSDDGIALAVEGNEDTVFSVSPAVEFGAEYALAAGGVARPYVKAGVTWLDTDGFVTSAAFIGAPAGVTGFAIETEIDDVVADIGAGVDFIASSGTVLRLQYDGRFGEEATQHGGSAKISVPF